MKRWLVTVMTLLSFACILSAQQKPCEQQAEYRQLDFWIGEWRVETPDGKLAGHNKIEPILDGCVIFENWTGGGGGSGKSFNYYDLATKKWHQKWVDSYGTALEFEGTIENDKVAYTGSSVSRETSNKVYHRLTIAKVSDNEVHQLWESSEDQETWKVVFDGKYLREEVTK